VPGLSGERSYPSTPSGWSEVERRRVGPFTTGVVYRTADGTLVRWRSRFHRKHRSRLHDLRSRPRSALWAPRRVSWWIGILFAVGSTCFLVGPLPGFAAWAGAEADAWVFFVGSLFFTSAAALQYLEAVNADGGPAGAGRRTRLRVLAYEPARIDWWSSAVQLVGTLFFNVSTFAATRSGLSVTAVEQHVWRPDVLGSICFLVASWLAWVEVFGNGIAWPGRSAERWIAAVNMGGSIAFGISALAATVLPDTGAELDAQIANVCTALGALGFLVGALLLLPESRDAEAVDVGPATAGAPAAQS
jgi:hypothetical protein